MDNTIVMKKYYDNEPEILKQSNDLSLAHYDFSLIEKRILYIIFNEVQMFASRAENQEVNFGKNLYITFSPKRLELAHDHITRAYEILQAMREKTIEIVSPSKQNKLSVGIINYVKWDKFTGELLIEVSHKILPYLLYLQQNFTIYSISVALKFKSVYTQRFYELLHTHRHKGYFSIDIKELRYILCLGNKCKQFQHLKDKILNIAQQELDLSSQNKISELSFQWEVDKSSQDGKAPTRLNIIILDRMAQANIEKLCNWSITDLVFLISMELSGFGFNKSINKKIISQIIEISKEKAVVLYQKLGFLKIKYSSCSRNERIFLMRKILWDDFKIKI